MLAIGKEFGKCLLINIRLSSKRVVGKPLLKKIIRITGLAPHARVVVICSHVKVLEFLGSRLSKYEALQVDCTSVSYPQSGLTEL